MRRPEKQIFERLGSRGLVRVLDDLMDQPRLIRLANSCGLKYPGMRTQSQDRARILDDLAGKVTQVTARKAIYRALQKETRSAQRSWNALSDQERARRLEDDGLVDADGNLGLHLYLLALGNGDVPADALPRLLERAGIEAEPSPARGGADGDARETARLKKRVAELQKKTQHLEGQFTRSREAEKTTKRDLIQRKGELAESRMLAERLRRELDAAQTALNKAASASAGDTAPSVDSLVRSVRKLAAEQKKLTHELTRLATARKPRKKPASPLLEQISATVTDLAQRWGAADESRERKLAEQGKCIADLQRELRNLRKSLARTTRRARVKGEDARVGVFIDVQNVYYAARRLKGKLDFDALLQAAVGERRLIEATAYVVESKEIDQSGFIAVLQQRGIEVRRKNLKVRADGSMKGDWDMDLALDILDAAAQLDVVVLVSGDGDFTSLVKRVKRMGPRVELIGFPRNTAKSLLEAADTFVALDRKFMIYPPRRRKVSDGDEAANGQPTHGEKARVAAGS